MLLLGQKAESIAMVKQKQRLPMAEGAFKLLESVHTVPGEYSEILVRNAWGIGVGRLVVSDFNKLLYSSKAQDVMAIKAWQDRGCTLPEAINRVLQERSGKREDSDAGQPADSGQKVA
jgi:conjugal transfer ATP-binding protein TraC